MKTVKYKGECYDLSKDLKTPDPFLAIGQSSISMLILVCTGIATVLALIFATSYAFVPLLLGAGLVLFITMSNKPTPSSEIPNFIKKYGTEVTCPDMDTILTCIDNYETKNCQPHKRCMETSNKGYDGCLKEHPCNSYDACNYKGEYTEI